VEVGLFAVRNAAGLRYARCFISQSRKFITQKGQVMVCDQKVYNEGASSSGLKFPHPSSASLSSSIFLLHSRPTFSHPFLTQLFLLQEYLHQPPQPCLATPATFSSVPSSSSTTISLYLRLSRLSGKMFRASVSSFPTSTPCQHQ